MTDLQLALNGEYFDAIADGRKFEEYRKCTPYWAKRLDGRKFRRVILTRGYPPAGDPDRTLVRQWRGDPLMVATLSRIATAIRKGS